MFEDDDIEALLDISDPVAPVRRVGGRPPKFKPEYVEQAQRLCAKFGATDDDLAEFFAVAPRTIRNWYAAHPEFRAAVTTGKDAADDRVERALFQRAVGYTYDSEKVFMPANRTTPVIVPMVTHTPPDTTACIFWLKNRRRSEWRDKLDHGITGKDDGPVQVDNTNLQSLNAADKAVLRELLLG